MTNFLGFLLFIVCAIGMLVHIVVCVTTNWAAMLILGLVFFPVGVIHGLGIIFGVW